SYCLSDDEVKALSLIWVSCLDADHFNEKDIIRIIKTIYPRCLNVIEHLGLFINMLDKKALSFTDEVKSDYQKDHLIFFENNLTVNVFLKSLIVGDDISAQIEDILSEKVSDNHHFISNICRAMHCFIGKINRNLGRTDTYCSYYYSLGELEVFFKPVIDAINESGYAIDLFFQKNNLDFVEKIIVLILLYKKYSFSHNFVDYIYLLNLISYNEADALSKRAYLIKGSKLTRKSIITPPEDRVEIGNTYCLESRAYEHIFGRKYKKEESIFVNMNDKKSEHLVELETVQKLNQLILPSDTRHAIVTTMKRFSDPEKYDLSSWGLINPSLGTKKKEKVRKQSAGLNILFYGVPGTGKTFAAGAIANELNKKLLIINAGKMRDPYYGQSEIKLKNMFEEMKSINNKAKNPPVFLLNESDQLLHTRTETISGNHNTENTLQNILLEELETFSGILIATTNLISTLDDAIFRRFHLKIEFKIPDSECRRKIWQAHLLPTIPGSSEIDIDYLADSFEFTGGQIRIIVENACAAAILREENQRRLFMDDLIRYAEMETIMRTQTIEKQIGFVR
ncbi:MAG: ATP-binding protein, partial [Candidatus Cloacimonetes bacterium]|nr:ATP-binding protein [Candidatus Cloacimonadota bacterium]